MKQSETALLVEVFLKGARIKGVSSSVGPRTRLAEILNSPDETLQLSSVFITLTAGPPMRSPSLAIQKKAIVAAIPWETKEQDRQRALAASISGRIRTIPTEIVVFSPPFVIAGKAHPPGGLSAGQYDLKPDPNLFSHFFSVTDARVTLPDGSSLEAPIVLINREMVAAMARSAEAANLRLAA